MSGVTCQVSVSGVRYQVSGVSVRYMNRLKGICSVFKDNYRSTPIDR
jgi:hypothetical protein